MIIKKIFQEPRPKKVREEGSLWDKFDSEVQEQNPSPSFLPDAADMDLKNFFSLPLQPRNSNPLTWWAKEGRRKFPQMYSLAVKYLSIPATSVPSERVFSAAGEVISKKRNRIGDKNARMLVVLHGNLQ